MFRWILLAVLVVGVSAAIPLAISFLPADSSGAVVLRPVSKRSGPQGKLFVDGDPEFKFGVLSTRTKQSHEWTVKNTGEGDLELQKGASSCQCTVANFEKDPKTGEGRDKLVLKPGQSTVITVTYDTKDNAGPFEKTTSLLTSDPGQPEFVFRVSGSVRPPIVTEPSPPMFEVGSVQNIKGAELRMAMTSFDQPDFKITGIRSSKPAMLEAKSQDLSTEELNVLSSRDFKNGYRVDISVKPSQELGVFSEEIVLTTDHPKMPEIRIPVTGRFDGPISLVPTSLRIGDATGSNGGKGTVLVSVREHASTQFSVDTPPDNLQAEIVRADVAGDAASPSKVQHFKLTVTVPPGTAPGVYKGALVLKSDHPQVSQLRVPYDIIVLSD